MLVRVCHLADCLLATNFATAKLVLDTLARQQAVIPTAR
jgi:methylglyoxal synthase